MEEFEPSLKASRPTPPRVLELTSDDPVSTQKFLETVFGWHFDPANLPNNGGLAFETSEGTPGFVHHVPADARAEEISRVRVTDIDSTFSRAQEAGGALVLPRVEAAGLGSFFVVRIPGGPMLTCWQSARAQRPPR